MVAQAVSAHQRAYHSGEAGEVDGAWGDVARTVMVVMMSVRITIAMVVGCGGGSGGCTVSMRLVRAVLTDGLEEVLEVMRDEVEAAKDEKDRHGEAGQDLGALETEGVADGGAAPDFEIAQHVDSHTHGRRANVEEDQVGEGRHGEGPLGAEEDIHGDGSVTAAPPEPRHLVALHASPGLLQGRYRERCGQHGRWSWRRFLEYLVLGAY
jgi:hypothetical protein